MERNANNGAPALIGDPRKEICVIRLGEREVPAAAENHCTLAVPVEDWNRELSPWEAPPVFGREPFGDGAEETLSRLLSDVLPAFSEAYPLENRRFLLAGYSLAGLFALWAAYQTDAFAGIAAVSPSVWFPGWTEYAETHPIRCPLVYLSLGDQEAKTRNARLATVETAIREQYERLKAADVNCTLEFNPGNHFTDCGRRVDKGVAWLEEQLIKG